MKNLTFKQQTQKYESDTVKIHKIRLEIEALSKNPIEKVRKESQKLQDEFYASAINDRMNDEEITGEDMLMELSDEMEAREESTIDKAIRLGVLKPFGEEGNGSHSVKNVEKLERYKDHDQ